MKENDIEYNVKYDINHDIVTVEGKDYDYLTYMNAISIQNNRLMTSERSVNNKVVLTDILEEIPNTRCAKYCGTNPNNAPVGGSFGSYKLVAPLNKAFLCVLTVTAISAVAAFFTWGASKAAEAVILTAISTFGNGVVGMMVTGYLRREQAFHSKCPIYIKERRTTYLDAACKQYPVNGTTMTSEFYSQNPY